MTIKTTSMSVTRALSTLKSVTEQIENFFSTPRMFVGVAIGETTLRPLVSTFPDKAALENRIRSDAQTLEGLLKRQMNIKAAIFRSNHQTMVTVNGVEMTVVEAVYLKSTLPQREKILTQLRNNVTAVVRSYDEARAKIDAQTQDLREKQASANDSAANKELIDVLEKNLRETARPVYVDPINYQKMIDDAQKLITHLKNELDFTLSTSNTVTMVEIPD